MARKSVPDWAFTVISVAYSWFVVPSKLVVSAAVDLCHASYFCKYVRLMAKKLYRYLTHIEVEKPEEMDVNEEHPGGDNPTEKFVFTFIF
jgi:hypothetical protein